MDRKSVLIIVLVGLLCNSCIYYNLYFNRNYYRTENTRPRPILPRFRLAKPEPYRLKAEDQIDTTVIYMRKYKILEKDIISFYRFFGNGRVAFDYLEKDSLSYNNIKRNVAGYYRMRSSTELELERFMAYSTTHAKYSYSRGIVKGDTLFMYFNPPKNKPISELRKDKEFSIYLKQKVDTLTGTPDW